MDRYRIGTIAGLLGISSEALRLYEREGVIDARREDGSGRYRSYCHQDVGALLRARTYRGYGFSLRETGEMLNEENVDRLTARLCRREEELERELCRKQRTLALLRETRLLAQEAPRTLGIVRETVSPEMLRFEYMCEDELTLPPQDRRNFRVWSAAAPLTFPLQRYHLEKDGAMRVYIALGACLDDARVLSLPLEGESILRHPAQRCLYTVIRVQGAASNALPCLKPLWEYAAAHGLTPCGDAFGRAFLSFNQKNEYTRFRQVWLPVRE